MNTLAARATGVRPRGRRPAPHRCFVLSAGIVAVLLSGGCGAAEPLPATSRTVDVAITTTPTVTPDSDVGTSLVATAHVPRVVVRTTPGGSRKRTLSSPTISGSPLVLRVLTRRAGWLKVSLPMRPNGSTGWVADADVDLSVTPYRLIVSKSRRRLDVELHGRRVERYPVGIGKAATPTPVGTYYLTDLIQPPDPSGIYGPYAFGLSAYSDTLTSFAGGPGQIGLHGTNAPTGLGRDVSHGCVRLANAVITHLARELPLGTPVEIAA